MNGIEIVFDSVSDAVNYHAAHTADVDYLRIQANLAPGATRIDNAAPENLATLMQGADDAVRRNRSKLQRVFALLRRG